MITPSHFSKVLFANGPAIVENMVSDPYICLWITTADGIFYILAADSFTFLLSLPIPSQKGKRLRQYEIGVSFYMNLYVHFF